MSIFSWPHISRPYNRIGTTTESKSFIERLLSLDFVGRIKYIALIAFSVNNCLVILNVFDLVKVCVCVCVCY